jgi:uncharacterized protein (TIGR00725 family)
VAEQGRRYAAVIGPGDADEATARLAFEVARGLAERGFVIVTGGEHGAMEAAARGGRQGGGTVVGILPGIDRTAANPWSDVTVVSGIGHGRNLSVAASADVVVAVGGGWGTLSEIGLAGVLGRPVVLLAGWRLEHTGGLPDEVTYAESAEEAVERAVALAGGLGGKAEVD